MFKIKMSYLTWFVVCLLIVCGLFTQQLNAANVSLSPDSLFFTSGVNEEFELELLLDENTTGVRLFQVYINYQPSLLDTVSTQLGSLFASSGFGAFFKTTIVGDSITGDTALRVEGLLLGPGAAVDGPGVAAIIRFRIIGAGTADLSILNYTLTDVNNDTIPGLTALGAVAYLDVPPEDFNLISPDEFEEVTLLPNDSVALIWENTTSPYSGEGVDFFLEYSTSSAFVPESTVTISTFSDTFNNILASELRNGLYYWRVTATGDIYNFKRVSEERWFDYSDGTIEPSPFNLLSPFESEEITGYPGDSISFSWEKSISVDIIENIFYQFEYSTSAAFEPGNTILRSGLVDTGISFSIDDFSSGVYYWRVSAQGDIYSGLTPSSPFPGTFTFIYGAIAPEDFSLVTPITESFLNNNSSDYIVFDWEDALSIILDDTIKYIFYLGETNSFPGSEIFKDSVTDLSQINVDTSSMPIGVQLYWQVKAVNKFDLETWSLNSMSVTFFYRGDVDNNGQIDISDLLYLVDYMFLPPGAAPPPVIYLSGDMECSNEVDITDLLFLVDYMFLPPGSTPFPGCIY